MALAHNALIIATCQGIFLGLAWIFVLCRLYIRKFMVRGVAIDDYFLILTTCLYTVFAAVISVTASIYVFNHKVPLSVYAASLDQVSRGVHYFYLAEVFYVITAAFLRITVGFLLVRIAHTRAQKITIYMEMLLMVLISTAFLGVVIFQCTPVAWYWDYNPADALKGHCDKRKVLAITAYIHAGISFVSDWILGLLPIWLLWTVQISRNKKVGVAFTLGLGLLCGIAAISRTVYIGRLDAANFETNWTGLALCSVIEPGLGIITASIAAFRPMFATQWYKSLGLKASSAKNIGKKLTERSPRTGKREEMIERVLYGPKLGKMQQGGKESTERKRTKDRDIRTLTRLERPVGYGENREWAAEVLYCLELPNTALAKPERS